MYSFESAVRLREGFDPSRGKSELHKAGCRLTAGEGDFKDSATENYRPKG